jgi:hypothetical protein
LVEFFKYSPLKQFGPKFDRKHQSKFLYNDCTFRRDPVTNMAATAIIVSEWAITKIFSSETA